MCLSLRFTYVYKNFSNLEAIIKKIYRHYGLKKHTPKNHVFSMFLSLQSKKRIRTRSVYIHVLHTCIKSYQPRVNNKKVVTNVSPISTSIAAKIFSESK